MLNAWFSSNGDICADNYFYSRFKLKDKCRSEKWEVYLFGQVVDMPAVVNDRCLMVQTVQKTVDFYGPDHRDFTVAVQLNYGRCPCCVSCAGSTAAFVVETAEIPQLQDVEHSSLYGGGGEDGVFARLRAFFALRPLGRRVPGGGDAGSLLPGVLPPELGATVMIYRQRSLINTPSEPHTPHTPQGV